MGHTATRHAIRLCLTLAIGVASPWPGRAQTDPLEALLTTRFETVSVRRLPGPTVPLGIRQVSDSRFSAVLTARGLIQLAYGYPKATLFDYQVIGGPPWIAEDRFEINATLVGPVGFTPGAPPIRLIGMVRALLADRFRLQLHQETRPLGAFDLVVGNSDGRLGPRLVRSDGTCLPPTPGIPMADRSRFCGVTRAAAGGLSAKGITLPAIAELLSFAPEIQSMVRDLTQLDGPFDVDVDFSPVANAANARMPSIFVAVKEQLGLELRPTTSPVNVVVVDAIEPPAPD